MGPGGRFCLDAASWKAAADKGIEEVPRVKLEASHEKALESVGLDTLKRWAAGQDVESKSAVMPKEGKEGWARESGSIGGKEPKS